MATRKPVCVYAGDLKEIASGDTLAIQADGIATTYTDAMTLGNATASTSGVPVQQSPNLTFKSNVWNTSGTPANNTFDARITFIPTSGATPTGKFSFAISKNGAAFVERLSITDGGAITAPGFNGSGAGLTNLNAVQLTGTAAVGHGGTGVNTLAPNGVVLGNGTSAVTTVVGTAIGQVLTWNGTTWTATAPSGGSGPTLATNGTSNGSQSLLNLVAGTGVTLSDNGTGSVTINSTGGGGSSEVFALITSADVSITAGSLTTITGLTLSIAAGETWVIEVHLNGTSSNSAQTRFGFGGPSSPTLAAFRCLGPDAFGETSSEFVSSFGSATAGSSAWSNTPAYGSQNTWHAYGTVIAGASSGTFAVQGYTASGTLVIKKGSYLRAVKQ